ncbi:MAG: flavin reductase family protein [Clostridia bacterium]|nr:flavin reductase family protein [Clostridia bacterium]
MKKNIGNVPYIYPIPIVLIGCVVNGKINYTEVGDVAVMGINPPLVAISLNENHFGTEGIVKSAKFSINIPTAEMMERADYCGIYSGKDEDKGRLFMAEMHETGVPMIKECPVCIICNVIKDFNIKHRHIFIGEVLGTYIEDRYMIKEDGKEHVAPLDELNPLLYGLDNKYYSIGNQIGTGYKEGKKITSEQL